MRQHPAVVPTRISIFPIQWFICYKIANNYFYLNHEYKEEVRLLFIIHIIYHMVGSLQESWLLVQNSLVFSLSFKCCVNFLGYNSTSITVRRAITCHLTTFKLQMEFIPYRCVRHIGQLIYLSRVGFSDVLSKQAELVPGMRTLGFKSAAPVSVHVTTSRSPPTHPNLERL